MDEVSDPSKDNYTCKWGIWLWDSMGEEVRERERGEGSPSSSDSS